jgi:copper chaperone
MPVLEFKIGMTCGGCSGAIKRIVGKNDGMELVGEPNLETKQVLIKSDLGHEAVMAPLMKWSKAAGKTVEFVGEFAQ